MDILFDSLLSPFYYEIRLSDIAKSIFQNVAELINIYSTKKKHNSKIFPLSFPFNAKMLIVIKYLFLIQSY